MRIGLIVDNEYNNDPRVSNEAKALHKAGFDVKILCFNYGSYKKKEFVEGVNVTRVRINKKLKNFLFGIMNSLPVYHYFWKNKIVRFIRKEKIDVIHVADLYMSRSGYLAKSKTGVILVVDLKENYPAAVVNYEWTKHFFKGLIAKPYKWKKLERSYLRYADFIVTMCDVLKERLIERYSFLNAENIFIYMNVPDTDFLLSQPGNKNVIEKKGSFVVVYFGGVAIRRGIITAIEAVCMLRMKKEDIKLLIIGPVDNSEKDYFNTFFNNPVYNEILIYIPWIELSELPSYLTKADVGISPIIKSEQHETTIANKMFQYSLFGKPIIVSDCEPQVRIVSTDGSGLIFRSEDAEDLASKILYLKNNPEIARQMGENGKRAVLTKYNLNEGSKDLLFLYEKIFRSFGSLHCTPDN
jgi:glycosyltransferase involved in cell wall biosynthesis